MNLTRQHDPELASALVVNSDQQFAERQACAERTYPDLLGRGLVHADRFGALQTATCALDQQGAQIGITPTTDRYQSRLPTAGMLGRNQPKPGSQLASVAKLQR